MHEHNSQHLKSLRTLSVRNRTGLYLIEGIRHVARALEEQAPIQSLFISPAHLTNPFGQKLARKLGKSGVPVMQLAPNVYRDLTLAAEPQGIGAVVRQRWCELPPIARGLYLAVESIDSPGNLGTIIRTAEATGVSAIIVASNAADPHDPATVRASMGSLFSQRLIRASVSEFTDWARTSEVAMIGSSPSGLLDYKSFRTRRPAALLIGSERQGLSTELLEACDLTVRIPMLGRGDSINAAVAAGVLLYELMHGR